MSSAARDWLQRHAAGVPPSLHARMLQACDDIAAERAGAADLAGAADVAGAADLAGAADVAGAADLAGAGHDTAAAGRVLARSLARAAISCMREAVERCDERTAALPLLAADALITAACAAAADDGAAAVEEVCAHYAPDRLGALLAAP